MVEISVLNYAFLQTLPQGDLNAIKAIARKKAMECTDTDKQVRLSIQKTDAFKSYSWPKNIDFVIQQAVKYERFDKAQVYLIQVCNLTSLRIKPRSKTFSHKLIRLTEVKTDFNPLFAILLLLYSFCFIAYVRGHCCRSFPPSGIFQTLSFKYFKFLLERSFLVSIS